jgi:hypothetical protein
MERRSAREVVLWEIQRQHCPVSPALGDAGSADPSTFGAGWLGSSKMERAAGGCHRRRRYRCERGRRQAARSTNSRAASGDSSQGGSSHNNDDEVGRARFRDGDIIRPPGYGRTTNRTFDAPAVSAFARTTRGRTARRQLQLLQAATAQTAPREAQDESVLWYAGVGRAHRDCQARAGRPLTWGTHIHTDAVYLYRRFITANTARWLLNRST